jgi:uncharacterized protein YpmS
VKIYRIARWVVLAGLVVSVFLLFKTPDPVSRPQDSRTVASNVESYQTKLQQLQDAKEHGESAEVHLTADEVSAAMSQAGTVPVPAVETTAKSSTSAPEEQPKISDYQVSFEGNVARGQFSTELAGKQVYVTVGGHLGARNGYVTFDPTEFKVGDLSVPVSLVNDQLQKKMEEQKDRLKLPDFVADLRVENGQLVINER